MSVAAGLSVRVWVPEVWDAVTLTVAPESTVAELKEAALRAATGRGRVSTDYVVKYRGAPILDEARRLADLGARQGSPFIVLPARRQPVR